MSLKYIASKIPKNWLINPPKTAHLRVLRKRIRLSSNQLYIDVGEVDNFINFYNDISNQIPTLSPITGLSLDPEGKEKVDTNKTIGGVQFMFPFTLGELGRHQLCVICYTPKKGDNVSKYYTRGHEEVEAAADLGCLDSLISKKVIPSGISNIETLANIGGVYACRLRNIPDKQIKEYMGTGANNDPPAVQEAIRLSKL